MKIYSILTLFLFTISTSSSHSINYNKNINNQDPNILKHGNHLFLTSEVNEDSKELFINGNNRLNTKNIYVYINSNGGSVLNGNDIIENIKFLNNTGHNITCIAQKAYSMAFHIFQHCNQRYITSSSTLMQHQMSLNVNGNYQNIKTYLQMIENINQQFIEYSAKKMQITTSEFKNNIMNDWWFYGINAIDYKAADKIVTIGCEPKLYNMKYIKKKRIQNLKDLFSENSETIELNGCPLLH